MLRPCQSCKGHYMLVVETDQGSVNVVGPSFGTWVITRGMGQGVRDRWYSDERQGYLIEEGYKV